MERIKTIATRDLTKSVQTGGCGECQTSCQSACKTSCGVANRSAENSNEVSSGPPHLMPPLPGGIFLCFTEDDTWYTSINSTGTTSCLTPAAARSTWWTTWPTTPSPCIPTCPGRHRGPAAAKVCPARPGVTAADLEQCLDDIGALKAAGKLWSPDVYEGHGLRLQKPQQRRQGLCLHVAHTCNLNCSYCFAARAATRGERALMSLEVGKRAMEFLIEHSGSRRNLEGGLLRRRAPDELGRWSRTWWPTAAAAKRRRARTSALP